MATNDFFEEWKKKYLTEDFNSDKEAATDSLIDASTNYVSPFEYKEPEPDPFIPEFNESNPINLYNKVESNLAAFGVTQQRELHGFGGATFLHGLSFHTLGKEPETTGGTVASIFGELTTMLAASLVTEGMVSGPLSSAVLASGRGSLLARTLGSTAFREGQTVTGRAALNLPGQMVVSGLGGSAVDTMYQYITPEDEPSYMYYVYPFLNAAFPAILSGFGKVAVGLKNSERVVPGATGGAISDTIRYGMEAESHDMFHDSVLQAIGKDGEDLATSIDAMFPQAADSFEDVWKPTNKQLAKLGEDYDPKLVKSQLHYDLTYLAKLNREYDDVNFGIAEELQADRRTFLYGNQKEKVFYDKAWTAVKKDWAAFQKDMKYNLSPDEQRVLFSLLDGKAPIFEDNWLLNMVNNSKRLSVDQTPMSASRAKRLQKFADTVGRKIDAAVYGIDPNDKRLVSKLSTKMKELDDFLVKQQEYYEGHHDPRVRRIVDEVDATMRSLYENPTGVASPEFKATQNWVDAFKALQRFRGVEDVGFRTAHSDELLNDLIRADKKLVTRLNELNKTKFQSFELPRQAAQHLEDALYRGDVLEPEELQSLQRHLLTIIRHEMSDMVEKYGDLINPDLASRLKAQNLSKIAADLQMPPEVTASSLPSLEKETLSRNKIMHTMLNQLLENPVLARTLADGEGNDILVKSLDMLFASMGDELSQARFMLNDAMRTRHAVHNIVHGRLMMAPGMTFEDSILDIMDRPGATFDAFPQRTNVTEKGDSVNPQDTGGTATGGGGHAGPDDTTIGHSAPEVDAHAEPAMDKARGKTKIQEEQSSLQKELDDTGAPADEIGMRAEESAGQGVLGGVGGFFRRHFSTPRHLAVSAGKSFKTPILKRAMDQVVTFFDEAHRARLEFLRKVHSDLEPRLNDFKSWLSLNETAGKNLIKALDEISEYADSLMVDKNGKKVESVSKYKEIRPKVEARVRQILSASPSLKEGWQIWENARVFIIDTVNQSIDDYNRAIDQGLLSGDPITHMVDRPGWIPFVYEGDYLLKVVQADGQHRNLGIVFGVKEAHKRIAELLKGQEINGRVVLEPRFLDDLGDMVDVRRGIGDLDGAFGQQAADIKRALDAGEFTPETVHQVMYGNKLHRIMSDRTARISTEQGLAVAGRMGMRFASYIHMARRGRELAQSLRLLNLNRWSDYIKVYTEDIMGLARSTERIWDSHITSVVEGLHRIPMVNSGLRQMGILPHGRTIRSVANGLTFLGRVSALGFNPAVAIMNTFILPVNVAPIVGFRNAIWATRNLGRILNKSVRSAADEAFLQKGGITIRHSGVGMKDFARKPDVLMTWGQKAVDKLDNWSMWMFNTSEDSVRGITMYAARRQALLELAPSIIKGTAKPDDWQANLLKKISKKMDKPINHMDVAEEYAVQVMKDTNFDFDVTGLSELSRNPIAKPFMQFKTYFFKELEFLFGRGSIGMSHSQRIKALGMFLSLGGLMALPGIEELDQVSTNILGFSPKLYMRAFLPEILAVGLPSLGGVDLSDKMNVGTFTYAFNPSNIAGVGAKKIARTMGDIFDAAKHGQLPPISDMFDNVAQLKNLHETWQLMTTGRVIDRYGSTAVTDKNLNSFQMILRTMGFGDPHTNKIQMLRENISYKRQDYINQQRRGKRLYFEAMGRHDVKAANEIAKDYGLNTRKLESKDAYDRLHDSIPRDLRDYLDVYAQKLKVQ